MRTAEISTTVLYEVYVRFDHNNRRKMLPWEAVHQIREAMFKYHDSSKGDDCLEDYDCPACTASRYRTTSRRRAQRMKQLVEAAIIEARK